jgi:alkanesulfonate monooxygenase SsuD/methylene tetrahydromethanopterin reductase-like flavin-dependent oxidoreductase (luciferase family)
MLPTSKGGSVTVIPAGRTLRIRPSCTSTRPKLDAGGAYRGFFDPTDDPDELRRSQEWTADYFTSRGELKAAEVFLNLLDPDWLLEKDLVLIGSPETVARKLKAWAAEGSFNTFFGEFNFGQLAEEDVLRSIELFGTEVIPRLRDYEPF